MKWVKIAIAIMTFVGLAIVVVSIACAPPPGSERSDGRSLRRVEERILASPRGDGVYRFHDPQYNVTCWIYVRQGAGGISCLPDDMVKR